MRNSNIQSASFQSIPLASINSKDETFRITTRTDVDDLMTSIPHEGLLGPPLLIRKNSAFSIISGFRRISACQKLGLNTIVARILESDLEYLDCLRFAIADNAFQRPLNLIEISRSLQKLAGHLKNNKRMVESAKTLGLPTNPSIIKKLKNLCLLPQPIQSGILADTISLSVAGELQSLDLEDAMTFVRLFNQLKVGLNKQKEIITLVKEIARLERMSVQMVLEDQNLGEIVNSEDLDRGQKGRKIRTLLRRRRFPRLVEAESKFKTHHKKLKLGDEIQLIPPKEFEGTSYTLNMTFRNPNHLRALQTRLNKILQLPSFEKIFTLK